MGWRVSPLPANWRQLRAAVLLRDGEQCTAIRRDGARCSSRATDCHHTGDRDVHTMDSLTSLCRWHHDRITAKQAFAGKTFLDEKFPVDKHPGMID